KKIDLDKPLNYFPMLKKLQFLFLLLMTATFQVTAQLSVEGSNEYGRIFDIVYDQTTPNKLYGATLGNHIISSQNNGATWELMYTHPIPGVIIKEMKQLPGNKLVFTTNNPNIYFNTEIFVLDVA